MNILVLMAGPSDSFREAGHAFPKPLIEIAGKPLVQYVIERLSPLLGSDDRLIFLVRHDENTKYHISAVVKLLAPMAETLEIRGETAGAACSALLAVDWINDEAPLVIVNGDQLIEAELAPVLGDFQQLGWDGGIIVFHSVHPRWSFVKCGDEGFVIEAAEKRPISDLATAGLYYFKSGLDFVAAAQSMILKNAAVNGLFYVCPTYNELILKNKKIGTYVIDKEQYVSLATPQGVEDFERHLNGGQPNK